MLILCFTDLTDNHNRNRQDLQVHDHALVHLLPQVSPEDLDEGDLERGNLAMHKNACQIQLHLEPHIHIGTVDGGGPPQRKTPVGDLVQTRPLCIGQLLVPAHQGFSISTPKHCMKDCKWCDAQLSNRQSSARQSTQLRYRSFA